MRGWATQRFALTVSPGSLVCGSFGESRVHGTCRMERGRLLICVAAVDDPRPTACDPHQGLLFTLQPAARRP